MLLSQSEAVVYIRDVPEIEYRDCLFHVVQTIGDTRLERVMLPRVFMEGIASAVAAARLHCGARRVVPIRAVPDHATTSSGK